MSAPSPRRPSTTVAIRSVSLSRSSCAPATTVSPSAKQPSSATSGSSSIASGTSSAVDRACRRAVRGRPRGRASGSASGAAVARRLERAGQPRAHPLEDARRSRRASSSPPCRSPRAASRGRARRRRRGTPPRTGRRGRGSRRARASSGGVTVIRSPSRVERRRPPRSASARCGRGSARARSTVVRPSASSPASSTHDLTCAQATGSSYSMPRSGRPAIAQRREAVRRAPRAGRPSPQRRGDRGRPGGGGSTRVAVERPAAAVLPGEPAGQQAHQRAGVADVDRRAVGRPGRAGRRRR